MNITLVRTSTLIIEHAGRRIVTDPWFGRTMRGLPVFRRPGVSLEAIGSADVLLASHLHRDHFDRAAVRRLMRAESAVVGPRGTQAHLRERVPVHELAPWDTVELGPFSITATPAEHTGPPPAEINYLVKCGDQTVFFGGDARFSDAFEEIARRRPGIDVALLPIGGTLIFGHRTTMNPRDAVRACAILAPRYAIPTHEGGEWLPVPPASWHPGRFEHFARRLHASELATRACILRPGDTATFERGRLVRRRAWSAS